MKYTVKYWDDNKKRYNILYYPHLETALMMANKICHLIEYKVFINDGTMNGSYIVHN